MRERFKNLVHFAGQNLRGFLVLALFCLVGFLSLVLLSWLVGFWMNGLYGFHFELQSCWSGLGAIAAGAGSVLAMAGINMGRHYIDSKFNSQIGHRPDLTDNGRN